MRTIKAQGSYTIPQGMSGAGNEVSFDYEYKLAETYDELVATEGKADILAKVNQTNKEDAGNNARENSKRANGHSKERVLTPEEKAERSAQRKVERDALAMLKAGNIDEAVALLQGR